MASLKKKNILLFLIGTFSMTQIRVVGSIGISELCMFFAGPVLLMQNFHRLVKEGFGMVLFLLFLVLSGCTISSVVNDTNFYLFLRGFAAPYSILCGIVIFHSLLRDNFDGIKWFLIGSALTLLINTFFFQASVEASEYAGGETGLEAVAGIISSPIYWISRLRPWVTLPISAWYLSTPIVYSFLVPIGFAIFAFLTTESGRSAAVVALVSAFLVFLGRKKQRQMDSIRKYFIVFVIGSFVFMFIVRTAYTHFASTGALGEKAQNKYEKQSWRGNSALSLLLGGRKEAFIGIYAASRKPILGYGPWARDTDGVTLDFIESFGSDEDYRLYLQREMRGMRGDFIINCHSHIAINWLWYGILGVPFWFYVLYLFFNFYRKWPAVYPPWFGYFAITIPSTVWAIFFSPLGNRLAESFIIVCVLLVKAISEGRFVIPYPWQEPDRYERQLV